MAAGDSDMSEILDTLQENQRTIGEKIVAFTPNACDSQRYKSEFESTFEDVRANLALLHRSGRRRVMLTDVPQRLLDVLPDGLMDDILVGIGEVQADEACFVDAVAGAILACVSQFAEAAAQRVFLSFYQWHGAAGHYKIRALLGKVLSEHASTFRMLQLVRNVPSAFSAVWELPSRAFSENERYSLNQRLTWQILPILPRNGVLAAFGKFRREHLFAAISFFGAPFVFCAWESVERETRAGVTPRGAARFLNMLAMFIPDLMGNMENGYNHQLTAWGTIPEETGPFQVIYRAIRPHSRDFTSVEEMTAYTKQRNAGIRVPRDAEGNYKIEHKPLPAFEVAAAHPEATPFEEFPDHDAIKAHLRDGIGQDAQVTDANGPRPTRRPIIEGRDNLRRLAEARGTRFRRDPRAARATLYIDVEIVPLVELHREAMQVVKKEEEQGFVLAERREHVSCINGKIKMDRTGLALPTEMDSDSGSILELINYRHVLHAYEALVSGQPCPGALGRLLAWLELAMPLEAGCDDFFDSIWQTAANYGRLWTAACLRLLYTQSRFFRNTGQPYAIGVLIDDPEGETGRPPHEAIVLFHMFKYINDGAVAAEMALLEDDADQTFEDFLDIFEQDYWTPGYYAYSVTHSNSESDAGVDPGLQEGDVATATARSLPQGAGIDPGPEEARDVATATARSLPQGAGVDPGLQEARDVATATARSLPQGAGVDMVNISEGDKIDRLPDGPHANAPANSKPPTPA